MDELKIDSDIPVPPRKGQANRGMWAMVVRKMKVGDSIRVEDVNQRNTLAQALIRRYGRGETVVATRAEGTGFRVWRIA